MGYIECDYQYYISEQNDYLVYLPSLEKIRYVVFGMDGESVARPDGFNSRFFTFAWEVVTEDIYEAVVSFFCGHKLPKSITSILIMLIPKVNAPQDFSQYRLISLCNFINKLL